MYLKPAVWLSKGCSGSGTGSAESPHSGHVDDSTRARAAVSTEGKMHSCPSMSFQTVSGSMGLKIMAGG